MKSLTLRHSKKKVFAILERVLKDLDMEIEESSFRKGRLIAYFKGNLLSFGNRISIRIQSRSETQSVVKISSRSATQIQVIDWGTNEKLEEKIINGIKYALKA